MADQRILQSASFALVPWNSESWTSSRGDFARRVRRADASVLPVRQGGVVKAAAKAPAKLTAIHCSRGLAAPVDDRPRRHRLAHEARQHHQRDDVGKGLHELHRDLGAPELDALEVDLQHVGDAED